MHPLAPTEFEKEVLRVARQLWPADLSGGAELVDGRERDGVFIQDDVIHLLEVTVERSEDKAVNDTKKLSKLASELRKKHPDKVVKCWFVTRDEPTDRQRAITRAANYPVQCVGFREFQGKLINAHEYLAARSDHRFGSVSRPDEMGTTQDLKYIELDIKERGRDELWSTSAIAESLVTGRRFVLSADFGAGKSMTLRELFFRLKACYLGGKTSLFPVHINLREHSGAEYPDEILERHARLIGFPRPEKLVRAWRAGYAILLLDGFDEITSLGFQARWRQLRDVRYQALKAVRQLVVDQSPLAGIVIAGREHYFDSYNELTKALGASPSAVRLTLNEFNDKQVERLLFALGHAEYAGAIPGWMPRRPLLLATLALRGYLDPQASPPTSSTLGEAWRRLITSICEREAHIAQALDPETIQRVLERVATRARGHADASGVGQVELMESFREVCGYEPDEQGILLLERLPGLGVNLRDEGKRSFVDSDLLHVLASGETARFYLTPWGEWPRLAQVVLPLSDLGVDAAIAALAGDDRAAHVGPATIQANGNSCLVLDLVRICKGLGFHLEEICAIADLHIQRLDLRGDSAELQPKVYFSDCIIELLDVDTSTGAQFDSRFQGCLISELDGVSSRADIPCGLLDERCEVESLTATMQSNNAVLDADLPVPTRVLLTVLRKLYLQVGAARQERAFYRGLDTRSERYVEGVLELVVSKGFARREKRGGNALLVPDRALQQRVRELVSAPGTSPDPLAVEVRALAG